MNVCEKEYHLLENILSEEKLDNLIRTTTSLQTLNSLFEIKHRRIVEGKSDKLYLSFDIIFQRNDVDIDLKKKTFKTALHVVEDVDTQIVKAFKYFVTNEAHNENEIYDNFKLLNAILEFLKENNKLILFEDGVSQLHNLILFLLSGDLSKRFYSFMLGHFLPNYLDISSKENKGKLLKIIFEHVRESGKLEILCALYDRFVSNNSNEDNFNLIILDNFWLLLLDHIVSKDSYVQKQSIYLLSKSIESSFNNLLILPTFLTPETHTTDLKRIWKNYLILLDISSEKQLHIVEPSLQLLNSIKCLHPLWRLSIYRIFLNHPQDVVVHFVVLFILQHETEWQNFSKIIKELLSSINKHEYSIKFKQLFKEIGSFCTKLNLDQLNILIEESLKISWIPTSFWCFCSNIFNDGVNFEISLELLENITCKIESIPHTYIRKGCTQIVLNYFIKQFSFRSFSNFLKFSRLLLNCSEAAFENFIANNKEKVLSYSENLRKQFEMCSDSRYIETVVKIIKILNLDVRSALKFDEYSKTTDMICLNLFQHLNRIDLEIYAENRIDFVEENEDIAELLLLLYEKVCTPSIREKATNILLNNNGNSNQKVIAFGIIHSANSQRESKLIINNWKNKFSVITEKIDENITQFFLKIYFRNVRIEAEHIDELIMILENILDLGSSGIIVVLENISVLLKFANKPKIFQIIEKYFDEFINLYKSRNFKSTSNIFLSEAFQIEFLENNKLFDKILDLTERLLNISNNYNTIAYILSQKITILTGQNPQQSQKLIPIIVELILYGIIINKNERVDYFICQEIGHQCGIIENNLNFEEMLVRLWALEAMLNLTESLDNAADTFASLLIAKYMKYFAKRYFPDSQIHLHKLRIIQALLLSHSYIKNEKYLLIDMISESFLLESHQPSVKHLMQWLLTRLLENDENSIKLIAEKLETFNNSRPSTVAAFIPILFHLVLNQKEIYWDQVVGILLPCTMGPQFKLRIFSQTALVQLYEKATEKNFCRFLEKYKFLYNSLKQVIEASENSIYDHATINFEFLDYFSLENCDFSTIFYVIPRKTRVSVIEWENLPLISNFKHLKFENVINFDDNDEDIPSGAVAAEYNENIQKKITPWKDILDDLQIPQGTNNFILVTSLLDKSTNLGGLSRTCEVFGVKQIVMRTSKITLDKEFKSLSMSSENWVDILEVKIEDLKNFIAEIKTKGYCVIGAEQTSDSVKLNEFKFPKMTVLVLGNEKEGIPPHLIPLLDHCIEIPQFGMTRSLNVHVAGAIVIWEYSKQYRL